MSQNGKKQIIFPEGDEVWNYLNSDRAICNECGALMDTVEDPESPRYPDYVCPNCGWKVGCNEYVYKPEGEWTDETTAMYGGNVPPAGCRACGGPYPACMSSCKLFDD